MKEPRALIALALLTLIWGYSWPLTKIALQDAAPFAFSAQRSFFAAIALFIAVWLSRRPMRLVAARKTFIVGLFQTSGFLAFQTWALVEGGAGATSVLIFTMPIWTLLLAWGVLGERIRGAHWIAAACALAGLCLIVEPWNIHTALFSKALGVIAAISWALGTALIKKWRADLNKDLLSFTAWQMLFGCLAVILVAALLPEAPTQWRSRYVIIMLVLAVISAGLGWFLWLYVLERLPAWQASLSILGVPVVANLSSRWQLGERLAWHELAGMLLIGGGLALLTLLNWRAAKRLPS